MKRHLFFILTSFLFVLIFTACDTANEPETSAAFNAVEFLLVDDNDPLSIETNTALKVDGVGPMYFRVLDLTTEQQDAIRVIAESYRDDFRALRAQWESGEVSWEDLQAQRAAIREQMNVEILALLTPEQLAIIEEIETQLANGEFPTILIEHRVTWLTEQLGLTTGQQDAIRPILAQHGADLLALREASSDREEFRANMAALMESLNQQFEAVLTAEQYEVFQQLKRSRARRGGMGRPGR